MAPPDALKAYRIRLSETLPAGAKRIAQGLLGDAMSIAVDDGRDLIARVHQCRKAIKSLRALLRLIRPCLEDERVFEIANGRLRAINHGLSGFRDAVVVRETLDTLELPAHLARSLPQLRGFLTEDHDAAHAGRSETAERDALHRFARDLEDFAATIDRWEFTATEITDLREGYRHTRNQCMARKEEAYLDGRPNAFHHWRRAAKRFYLQTQFLQTAFPDAGGDRLTAADDLQDMLGRHHDLAVLRERIRPLRGHIGPALFAALDLTVAVDMATLERSCRDLGEALFDRHSAYRDPARDDAAVRRLN